MPRQPEKTKRNREMFCLKEGIETPEQYAQVKGTRKEERPQKAHSYMDLVKKYDISLTRVQEIIKRERKRND